MPSDIAPFSFAEISETHQRLQQESPFFANMDIPQFAEFMNKQTGTGLFNHGLSAGPVKKFSAGFDRLLEPVSEPSGEVGSFVASLIDPSYASVGREVGESLPRGLLETGAVVGGVAAGPIGYPLAAAGAASAAAGGYEKTDSTLAGLIQGGVTAAIPASASLGRKMVQPLVRNTFFDPIETQVGSRTVQNFIPKGSVPLSGAAQRGMEYVGENMGLAINEELAIQGTSLALGQGLVSPTDPQHVAAQVGGVLPFALLDIPGLVRGPRADALGAKPRSVTEMEEMVKYLDTLKKKEQNDTADSIRRQLATQPKLALPPPSQRLLEGPESGFAPSAEVGTQRIFEAPEEGPAQVVREATGAWELRKLDRLTPEQAQRMFAADDETTQRLLQQWEERGLVGPPEPDGSRPVVGQFDEATIVNEALRATTGEPEAVARQRLLYRRQQKHIPDEVRDQLVRAGYSEQDIDAMTTARARGLVVEPEGKDDELDVFQLQYTEPETVRESFNLPEQPPQKQTPGQMDLFEHTMRELRQRYLKLAQSPRKQQFSKPTEQQMRTQAASVLQHVYGSGVDLPTRPAEPQVQRVPLTLAQWRRQQQQAAQQLNDRMVSVSAPKLSDDMRGMLQQFRRKFSPAETDKKMVQPQMHEVTKHAGAMADDLMVLLRDAAAVPEHVMNRYIAKRDTIKQIVEERLRLGATPLEAATHAYNMQMRELGRVLRLVEQEEARNAKQWLPTEADEPLLVSRVQRASTLSEEYGQAVVDVMNQPYFQTGSGSRYDASPYIIAAAVEFKENPAVRHRRMEAVRERKEFSQGKSEKEIEMAALRHHLKFAGLYRTSKPEVRRQQLRESLDERFDKTEEVAPTQDVAANEAAEEAAVAAEQEYRARIPKGEVPPPVWGIAGELAGRKPLSRRVDQQVDRFNRLLKMFNESQLGLRPHAVKGISQWVVDIKIDEGQLAKELGVTKQSVRNFINDEFIPRIRHLEEAQARWERIKGEDMPPDDALVSEFSEQRLREIIAAAKDVDPLLTTVPRDSRTSMVGAKVFFDRFFRNIGYSDVEAQTLSDVATKVAAAYEDVGKVRIGAMTSETFYGVFMGSYAKNAWGFIGLDEEGLRNAPAPLRAFAKMKTLGHELYHATDDAAKQGKLSPAKNAEWKTIKVWARQLSPEQRADMLTRIQRIVVPKRFHAAYEASIKSRASEAVNVDEFLADYAGLFMLGHVSPDRKTVVKELNNELMFSSHHEQQFMRGMYLPLRDITKSLERYFNQVHEGMAQWMHDVNEGLESNLRSFVDIQDTVGQLNHIQQFEPETWAQMVAEGVPRRHDINVEDTARFAMILPEAKESARKLTEPARTWLGVGDRKQIQDTFGVDPSFIERWFFPSAQLARLYPQLQDVFDLVRVYRAMQNDNASRILRPFLTKKSKLGRLELDAKGSGLETLAKNKTVDDAATKIALQKNLQGKVFTDEEMRAMMPQLSEDRQNAIISFHRAAEQAMPVAAALTIKFDYDKMAHAAASLVLTSDPAMKWKDALQMGTHIRDSFLMSRNQDATQAQTGMQMLQNVQADLPPNVANGVFRMLNEMFTRIQDKAERIADKPWFTPELRLGQYVVAWKRPDGSTGAQGFQSQAEAAARATQLKGEGASVRSWDKWDKQKEFSGMPADLVEAYAAVDRAAFDAAIAALGAGSEEMKAFQEMYTPGAAVMREVKARGVDRFFLPRKLAEGREATSVSMGLIHYISGLSGGLAKAWVRERVGLALRDPVLKKNPKLGGLAREHFETVINPPSRELTAFKNLNFAYFLGFNFSSMMIEGTQTLITLVPQLTRDTGSMYQSYQYLGKALRESTDALINNRKFKDPEMQGAVERAVREQRIDFGILQEFQRLDDEAIVNLRNLATNSGRVSNAVDMAKKPLQWYLHAAKWLYQKSTRANSYLSFVAAYRIAKEKKGFDPEQAYNFAVRTVESTMFGGGQAARPVRLFGNKGEFHSVMGVLYSMQTFTFSTVAMMLRLGKEAIGRSGLNAADRRAARKAFGQMMVTQTTMAGAMGLPFVAGIVALIEQMFPEVELERGIDDMFVELAQGDEDMGSLISDLAMRGAPYKALGIDVSSRIGLGNLLGVSDYDGFSLNNLIGPTGSVIENVAQSMQAASTGNFDRATEELMPNSIKNVLKLANDDFALRDEAGRLLAEPTTAEKVLYSLGLRPTRLSKYRETQGMVQRHEDIVRAELSRFHEELAQLLVAGNPGEVRARLLRKQAEDYMYDPVSGARRVVELAQQRNMPVDLARSGTRAGADVRQRLQARLGRQTPTEVELLLQRKSLGSQLGLPGQVTTRELSEAQMVDALMSQNPLLPRQEALQMVQMMRGQMSSL